MHCLFQGHTLVLLIFLCSSLLTGIWLTGTATHFLYSSLGQRTHPSALAKRTVTPLRFTSHICVTIAPINFLMVPLERACEDDTIFFTRLL